MGFLRSLFIRSNPTRAWQEDRSVSLIVDLDDHRFSGVGIGDPVEKFSFLGRGKVTPSGFAWPDRGIDVTADEGQIQELGFYFGHPTEPRGGTFAGVFRHRGAPVRLSRELTEPAVQALFGQPYWRDQDEFEVILFYEFPGTEWEVEFAPDGTLKHLRLCRPLLADPEARADYRVTKPWPPAFPESPLRRGDGDRD